MEENKCSCESCMHKKDFDMPNGIIDAVKAGRLVLFAGAGISTENKRCYPRTFYEEIKQEMNLPDNIQLKFSQIMSRYSKQPNGRRNLIMRIKERFDYVDSFPELYRQATSFHRELSSVYFIRDIITTNWDDYFERECGATPFTTAEDFVFWDLSDRRVLKIHGSIHNYGSLVITEADYQKCYKRLNKGLLGGYLKSFLATKTILFIGYSFGDEDFNRIQQYLSREMRGLNPHAYVVTIDESAKEKFEGINITPIITDGTFFIEKLKEILIKDELIIPNDIFLKAMGYLEAVIYIHTETGKIDLGINPEVIYSLSYQDGLIHALERAQAKHRTGEYFNPCYIIDSIQAYENKRKINLKKHLYYDVAYIDGYIDGLIFLIVDNEVQDMASPFYLFGYKDNIKNFEEYLKLINNGEVYHKQAKKHAEKIVKNISSGIAFHHSPFLS